MARYFLRIRIFRPKSKPTPAIKMRSVAMVAEIAAPLSVMRRCRNGEEKVWTDVNVADRNPRYQSGYVEQVDWHSSL